MSRHLHKDDRELWSFVEKVIWDYASIYGLAIWGVKPVKRRNTHDRYGQCSKNGIVRLSLRTFSHGRWDKRPELAYEIVDTIAHELAHLRHQKHTAPWLRLYAVILGRLSQSDVLQKIKLLRK
jgi:predicted metal-dependent hydrolase